MAYRFKRKERVGKGIRRILRQQLRRGIETARATEGPSQDERVHDVRTRIKRSRAAIELIGAQVGRSAKKTDKKVRNLGRRLAGPRDNAVQAHTFRILGTRLSRELPAGLLERMRDVGEQLRRDADAKSVEKELRRTARALKRVRRRLGRWRIDHGRRAIGEGVTRTYKKARRALAKVHADATPERFHDWRKLVKLLSNELKIVGPAVPELATRYAVKVEKLGDILGQIHDLDIAAATADKHPRWFGSDDDCEVVRGLVAEHRVVLEREAFALAEVVFAGRPRDVRELIETGWKTWRKRRPQVEEVATEQAA